MSENNKFINKNDFLEATRGGFDFYNFVMRKQGVNLRIKESNNSLKNPFYEDTKGSLSINFQNDEYLFNDFGDTRFRGDVLRFAGFYYDLDPNTELQKILINCCKDLGISNLLVVNNSFGIKAVIEREKFLEFELEYWANFGISTEILNKYDAVSVDYLLLSKKNYKLFSNKKNPIFAFKELECCKIYQPFSKKFKHQWFPKKKIDTPFGYKQLENQGDLLIIAAGEKDVLSLASQGYSAISLNSETQTNIDKDLLNDLSSRFRTIAVLYDIDETGKKAAKQLSEKYAFSIIELPNELLELGFGKDVSDYFKAVVSGANQELFSVEKFRELVEKSISIKQKLNAVPDLEYSNLPDFFQDLLSKFNSKQERDLILLSSLAVLSACIPNYYAIYDNFIIYPNLYLFVVGNPASGKGVIGFSRILVETLDNEIFEANKRMQELQQKDNDIKNISCPRKIILPANSSSTGFFELLHKNNGNGLIFETEADTLSYIFKKDYGDYSDGFRKAFHHEPISFYRRTQKEYICIQKPKLSVVLSGTPAQVFTLIQNNEDGLFSRFIFFLIIQKAEFKDVFASSENNIEDFFHEKGLLIRDLYSSMLQRKNPLRFEMTKNQKERFLKLFQDYQDLAEVLCGFGGSAIVFRFGVIFTRILMILIFFRGDFDFVNDSVIQSTDFDFETTCNLISSLVHHSIRVYQSYPEQSNRIFELSRSNQILYQELPDKFKRLEVLHLCKKFNISIPTLDRLLKNIQLFSKVGNGNYKKILMIK